MAECGGLLSISWPRGLGGRGEIGYGNMTEITPGISEYGSDGVTPPVWLGDPGPGNPHATCPRIWWGSEIPVDAYTYASSGRTEHPPQNKNIQIATGLAHTMTARCWGHGDLIPHGPETGKP